MMNCSKGEGGLLGGEGTIRHSSARRIAPMVHALPRQFVSAVLQMFLSTEPMQSQWKNPNTLILTAIIKLCKSPLV